MSPMTSTQQGMVGQILFAALVMMGSGGVVKTGFQTTDDEGRDVDVHLGGAFAPEFGIQVKTALELRRDWKHQQLTITFPITDDNMIDSSRYWYFLAHLPVRRMRFSDLVFLAPSEEVHAHMRARRHQGHRLFTFQGSMDPAAHDRWTPYRLMYTELGGRLTTLLRQAPKGSGFESELAALARRPGICWLGM